MNAGRPLASPVGAPGPPPGSGQSWRAPAFSPALLYLLTLGYAVVALAWAASGRGDAAFADASAFAGSVAAAFSFAAATIAATAAQSAKQRICWPALAAGAAGSAAVQIASLLVVRGDRVISWNPAPLQALAAAAPVALLVALLLPRARRKGWITELAPVLTAAIVALGASTLLLTVVAAAAAAPRWALLPATLAATAGVAVVLFVVPAVRRTPNAALLLVAAAWTIAALSHPLANWLGSPGWLGFGRWLLPIAALGMAVLAGIPAGSAREPGSPDASPAALPRVIRERGGAATGAGIGMLVAAIAIATLAGADVRWDVFVMAGLAALMFAGRQASSLAAERSRVAELANAAREWQRLANIDALTGLPNRASLLRRLTEEVQRALRYEQPLSVCFVDVDFFKQVNDRHGHPAGDVVLREVGERLRSTARIIDVVGRYGGEEFLVIVPGTWTSDALVLTERLRAKVAERPIVLEDGSSIPVTVSIGLAGLPEHAGDQADLLTRADAALYEAKRLGRNKVALYQPATTGSDEQ